MTAEVTEQQNFPNGEHCPRCSVIMPVYNTRSDYLREAIESILQQSFRDYELIVVDNGSGAYVRDVVYSYQDDRIKYLRIDKNQGAAVARNHGVEHARGEYVAFMDADDISLPERLEKQCAYMQQHPEVGCLGTGYAELRNRRRRIKRTECISSQAIECALIFEGCELLQSSLMLRRCLLGSCNDAVLYRRDFFPAEDYALLLDLIGKTKYARLEDVLVLYRRDKSSTSHVQKSEQLHKKKQAQKNILSRVCNMSESHGGILLRFLLDEPLQQSDCALLVPQCKDIVALMITKGYARQEVTQALRKVVRKRFYHTRSLRGQLALMHSGLHRYFRLPSIWLFWCFVTRGIL